MEEFPLITRQNRRPGNLPRPVTLAGGESSDDIAFANGQAQAASGSGTPADPVQFVIRVAVLPPLAGDAAPTVTLTAGSGPPVALLPGPLTHALFRAPETAEANLLMTAEPHGIYRVEVKFFPPARPVDFTQWRIRFTNNNADKRQFEYVVAARDADANAPRLRPPAPLFPPLERGGLQTEFIPSSAKKGELVTLFGSNLNVESSRVFFQSSDQRIEAFAFPFSSREFTVIVPDLRADTPYKITVQTIGGSATTTKAFHLQT